MNLSKKKDLAVKTLGIGRKRITFNKERLDEIKEAITKQDIRDLVKEKAISLREIKGKRKIVKRKSRRRAGSIKQKVNTRKKDYMAITRKLRAFIQELKKHETITLEQYKTLRKEIRSKNFKSKAALKERLKSFGEEK